MTEKTAFYACIIVAAVASFGLGIAHEKSNKNLTDRQISDIADIATSWYMVGKAQGRAECRP